MSRCILPVLGCLLSAGLLLPGTDALAQKGKEAPRPPVWTHAFDLKVRKGGERDWEAKSTRALGFEVFRDQNNDLGVYINETGALGLSRKALKSAPDKSDSPGWLHGLDVKVRRAGEEKFTDKTQVLGIEVFRDGNTGNLVYLTEKGFYAVAPGDKAGSAPTAEPKPPVWTHGLDLKVRKGREQKFDDAKVWSVEVFRDDNTGMLLYVSETGAIAIAAGPRPPAEAKGPEWLHGLDLKCRKGGVKNFEKTTQVFGLELFRDANNGNYLYLSEVGSLAVVRGDKNAKAPTEKPAEPEWRHGLDLKCRTFDEPTFNDKTRVYGVEVFNDPNTRATLYIDDVGQITAVAVKCYPCHPWFSLFI